VGIQDRNFPDPALSGAGLGRRSSGILESGESTEFLEIGSELGIILLLVMLGIEYSASELVTNLKQSKKSGLLDLLLNGAPGFALGLFWVGGLSPQSRSLG